MLWSHSHCTDADTIRALLIAFGYIGLIECILVVILTAANKKTMKWPGALRTATSARPHTTPGPLILIIGIGQVMIAFGNTVSSWISLHDMHCNSEARYINICRFQGFLIVSGTHVVITTYALAVVCIP